MNVSLNQCMISSGKTIYVGLVCPRCQGYLTFNGRVNLSRVQMILTGKGSSRQRTGLLLFLSIHKVNINNDKKLLGIDVFVLISTGHINLQS